RKPHPIRGILWGLLLGIGAAAMAILLKIIPLELLWAIIVVAAGVVIGILWSTLGPAKKPKTPPPYVVAGRAAPGAATAPDMGPVPPSPPPPPGLEPLNIQPLDVEPLDLSTPTSDDDHDDHDEHDVHAQADDDADDHADDHADAEPRPEFPAATAGEAVSPPPATPEPEQTPPQPPPPPPPPPSSPPPPPPPTDDR
ncbi:MAG: hypothetical protein ACRDZZ_09690, partial [Ilumatobacteraceae bacterium]